MKYFCLALLLFLIKTSSAQTLKYYVSHDGHLVPEKQGAAGYIYVQQLSDSAYKVSQYDMGDTLLSYSYYKDAKLTIPVGKFGVYQRAVYYNPVTHKDTAGTYLQQTGYFENGKRTGTWVVFTANNRKESETYYENGQENGQHIIYNYVDGSITIETMKNDMPVGSRYMYSEDSVLIVESKYEKGHIEDLKEHTQYPDFQHAFYTYLEKNLLSYKEVLMKSSLLLHFTVTEGGKIADPMIIKGVNAEVDSAMIAVLKNAPPIAPAKCDGKITKFRTGQMFTLYRPYHSIASSHPLTSWQVPHQRIQTQTYSTVGTMSNGGPTLIEYRVPSQ